MVDNSSEAMRLSHRKRLLDQIDWLETFPQDFESILDVGAGSGAHSEFFRDRGHVPTAIDTQPHWFLSHGLIEFISGNILDLDGSRKFDAIFSSHTLEHIPDTQQAMMKMRSLIHDGGYLFIVVPPYNPVTANDHWHTGWNCTQLAMWLVACGFDCSEANFVEQGQNVCGWGKKADIPATNFNIPASLPYLPKGLADAQFKIRDDDHLPDNLGFNQSGITLPHMTLDRLKTEMDTLASRDWVFSKLRRQRNRFALIAIAQAVLTVAVILLMSKWMS